MKVLNTLILGVCLTACGKPEASTPKSVPQADTGSTCIHDVVTVNTDFPYSNPGLDNLVFDNDMDSYADSGPVVAGDTRNIDIDYGCIWTFHKFELHYTSYTFGSVAIYTAPTASGPYTYLTSYDESTAQYDGTYWSVDANVTTQYVRYVLTNNGSTSTHFLIGDVEAQATYVSGN